MAIATSTALLTAGVAMAAAGSIAGGVAEGQRSKFEASDQRQRALREREIAAQNEEDFRRRASKTKGQSRANRGGSGVITTTGSPLLASADFDMEEELQALRIRAGGEVDASRLEEQASLTRSAGKSAQTRGFFRAGSSLLTGGAKVFS